MNPTCDYEKHPSPCACCDWRLRVELPDLRARLQAAESECQEQARLNGMGAEREAKLMAENERLRKIESAAREWSDCDLEDEPRYARALQDALALPSPSHRGEAMTRGILRIISCLITIAAIFTEGTNAYLAAILCALWAIDLGRTEEKR